MRSELGKIGPKTPREDSISDWFIILCIAMCPPVGIYLVAKYRQNHPRWKLFIIASCVYLAFILIGSLISGVNTGHQSLYENDSQLPIEEELRQEMANG